MKAGAVGGRRGGGGCGAWTHGRMVRYSGGPGGPWGGAVQDIKRVWKEAARGLDAGPGAWFVHGRGSHPASDGLFRECGPVVGLRVLLLYSGEDALGGAPLRGLLRLGGEL